MSQSTDLPAPEPATNYRGAIEIAIRLGLVLLLAVWCLQIVAPFIGIVIWAMIIAVAATTPYLTVTRWLGGRDKLAAAALVIFALLVLIVPFVMLSETLVSGAQQYATRLSAGDVVIPVPPDRVAEWPLVGERVHEVWQLASVNLEAALEKMGPQLAAVSRWLIGAAGSAGIGMLQMVASLVIAGILLARSEGNHAAMKRFGHRLAGEQGEELADLAQATVKSVVQGIVGVALIQTLLAGLGFIVADIPGAGLWALLVLVTAVVQLPVTIVMIPPIVLAFTAHSTGFASAFAVWCIFAGAIDSFLKPLFFGRGVEVPMIVIFVGAIGGMISMGIIGLFVGAVVLAMGYALFTAWMAQDRDEATAES